MVIKNTLSHPHYLFWYLVKFWISPYGQQVDVEVYMENMEDGTRYI